MSERRAMGYYDDLTWGHVPEYNDDGTEVHIVCEGARFHVISYIGGLGQRCSEPNCEINRDRKNAQRVETT